MKIIERIKSLGIIDDNNEIRIEEAVYKKISKKFKISVVLSHAIALPQYEKLKLNIDIIIKEVDPEINVESMIGYEDESLTKEELQQYLIKILNDLSIQSGAFRSLNGEEAIIEDNKITFKVACDAKGIDELLPSIKKSFEDYGLLIELDITNDETKSLSEAMNELDQQLMKELERQQQEAYQAQKFNNMIKESKNNYKKYIPDTVTPIKMIPQSHEDLQMYINENGVDTFLFEGYVFDKEIKVTKSKSERCVLKVTDESDSIMVCKWLRNDVEKEAFKAEMKVGVDIKVTGKAVYDSYSKQVIIEASTINIIGQHKEAQVADNAEVKRVELNCHTKMSTLDGLTEATDYVKCVNDWGWTSMAFTDTSGLYEIPDVDHVLGKYPNFKPIYGVELPYIDDKNYFITFDQRDINLKAATYVVFDIETTGFSQTYDEIIEIAAYKVYQGGIIETYDVFVNPKRHIRDKITRLTSITDEMIKDAKTIDQVLPEFLEFAKDSILVAHNAKFDVGMIYAKCRANNISFEEFPVIDTLNLFRVIAGYTGETKKFNLKVLSKYYKVKQEQHHRANDDTRVTALCFIGMLNDVYNLGVTNYNDINSLIKEEHYKYMIPSRINLIALNQPGYKNLLKIVSDSLTTHLSGDARLLRSVLEAHHDGIFVGSDDYNGDVFELALNRTEEECKEAIRFCDYIEVQPPSAYMHLYSSLPDGEIDIQDTIKKIIRLAKEENKIVVATSGCHYLRPNLKKYRNILIKSPQVGGGVHHLSDYEETPSVHLRTTDEMLAEFDFLDRELAYEIVVENTNKIADMVEKYPAFHNEMFSPRDDEFKDSFLHVASIDAEVTRIIDEHVKETYGDNPSGMVMDRLNRELTGIRKSGYASVYYMSYLMVQKSLSDGYLVGSRGSVGSSLVATMMDITEVNPLKPHYRCKKCKWHTFKMSDEEIEKYGLREDEKPFQEILRSVDSGYDLPNNVCPICGEKLAKDGHDIPFETFLGFDGDKTPDIDLNFSGKYQAKAHEYIRQVFGNENAFRAGTVGTIADKNAYGYVKAYLEATNKKLREIEIDRISKYLIGIKRSTGQHPGGVVVVPHYVDIYDVTPVQYPANDDTVPMRTTHYDYHKFEENLLKLDVLGHDDPTMIRFMMDYVHEHQSEFSFERAQDIPIDDSTLYRLFSETEVIGVSQEALGSKVASYGVPELGTRFVQQMLVETTPKTFAQLVKISGLSHGTNVWATNSQELVNGRTQFGKIEFADVIGCRDDIMIDLIRMGTDPSKAFSIMEFVRKNKKVGSPDKWADLQNYMRQYNVPEWYIWSCDRTEYLFPKAHATAYVLMALRIAWFKVYYPSLFYSAWLTNRAKGHDVNAYVGGPMAIKSRMEEINNMDSKTAKDDDLMTALQIALEMTLRGIKFLPVDIEKSDATDFIIEDGNLRIPFIAVDKLGESVALDIVEQRKVRPFSSKADVKRRTKLNNSLYQEFEVMHSFGNLPDEDKEATEGLFAFLD
ncbi:MAG: PolC-type DNA polymerase III [Acholeplasmatales bacterium]|nr:PolC-type DNA polymerase III [Acholeplasmatales bacterium]